ADVYDPNTSDLHVVPLQLVRAADENVVATLSDVYEVVCDEAMSALDQVQHAFAFPDAALPHKQQPHAVHVRERAVQRCRWGELLEVADRGLDEHLDASVRETLREPGQHQAGAGDRGRFDAAVETGAAVEELQSKREALALEEVLHSQRLRIGCRLSHWV